MKDNWLAFDVILTQSLVVFDLVSLPTKERSGSFLEETLGRTRDVEIWRRMAAASRQTLWTEALWKRKSGSVVGRGSLLYSHRVTFSETGRQTESRADRQGGSYLCEEIVPQNVVQVRSVLGDLGEQGGD